MVHFVLKCNKQNSEPGSHQRWHTLFLSVIKKIISLFLLWAELTYDKHICWFCLRVQSRHASICEASGQLRWPNLQLDVHCSIKQSDAPTSSTLVHAKPQICANSFQFNVCDMREPTLVHTEEPLAPEKVPVRHCRH
jgi:hypothetical protein